MSWISSNAIVLQTQTIGSNFYCMSTLMPQWLMRRARQAYCRAKSIATCKGARRAGAVPEHGTHNGGSASIRKTWNPRVWRLPARLLRMQRYPYTLLQVWYSSRRQWPESYARRCSQEERPITPLCCLTMILSTLAAAAHSRVSRQQTTEGACASSSPLSSR